MDKLEKIKIVLDKGYYINNIGEVFSRTGKKRKLRLSGSKQGTEYYSFNVKINKISYPIRTYYLQAYKKFRKRAFVDGIQIRHLDSNSLNNSYENIGIGTVSDNMMDRSLNLRQKVSNIAWKAGNPRKITEREIIYELLYKEVPYKEIRRKYDVALGTLSYMKNKSKEYQKFIENKPVC